MAPSLMKSLSKHVAKLQLNAGSVIMCRMESRIFILHVIESWYEGCTAMIKGLELQGTSCHALEATRIDDIFNAAFDIEKATAFNTNWFHVLKVKTGRRERESGQDELHFTNHLVPPNPPPPFSSPLRKLPLSRMWSLVVY